MGFRGGARLEICQRDSSFQRSDQAFLRFFFDFSLSDGDFKVYEGFQRWFKVSDLPERPELWRIEPGFLNVWEEIRRSFPIHTFKPDV